MADVAAKRQEGCMGGISALPEDVLLGVFSRVGNVKDLFMFAITCRGWLRRFTDPAFLCKLCPSQGEGHHGRLLGFFFQETDFTPYRRTMVEARRAQRTSAFAPTFLPAPGSPLGPTARALTSFVADDDGSFNYAVPISARRGIVLMWLVPRTLERDTIIGCNHLFGLCNPITGDRHVLPPLRCMPDDMLSYAIITAADTDLDLDLDGNPRPPLTSRRFMLSQLIIIKESCLRGDVYLISYSAATRSWSKLTRCLVGRLFARVGEKSAVVHQGAAHWLYTGLGERRTRDGNMYRFSVEVATLRFSMTKLPIRGGGNPFLSVSRDGKLVVTCVYPAHVTIWTPQAQGGGDDGGDDAPAMWPRTSFRVPSASAVAYSHIHWLFQPKEKWFNFNRGSMLVLYRNSGIFILDLDKKEMVKVMDCFLPLYPKLENWISVPYEVDLVEFFTLQLGGVRDGLATISETESS